MNVLRFVRVGGRGSLLRTFCDFMHIDRQEQPTDGSHATLRVTCSNYIKLITYQRATPRKRVLQEEFRFRKNFSTVKCMNGWGV